MPEPRRDELGRREERQHRRDDGQAESRHIGFATAVERVDVGQRQDGDAEADGAGDSDDAEDDAPANPGDGAREDRSDGDRAEQPDVDRGRRSGQLPDAVSGDERRQRDDEHEAGREALDDSAYEIRDRRPGGGREDRADDEKRLNVEKQRPLPESLSEKRAEHGAEGVTRVRDALRLLYRQFRQVQVVGDWLLEQGESGRQHDVRGEREQRDGDDPAVAGVQRWFDRRRVRGRVRCLGMRHSHPGRSIWARTTTGLVCPLSSH